MENYKITADSTVRLPVGLHLDGEVIYEVTIDEWRFIDSAKLSSEKAKRSGTQAQMDVIARLIQTVGGFTKTSHKSMCPDRYVKKMHSADASVIIATALALAGQELQECEYVCTKCGTEAVEELSLLELEVVPHDPELPPYVEFELPRGVDASGPSGEGKGKRGHYHFPTLFHEKLTEKAAAKGPLYKLNGLLVHCVRDFDYSDRLSSDMVDDIGLEDQNYLMEVLAEGMPGLETAVKSDCPECMAENILNFDLAKYFLSRKK